MRNWVVVFQLTLGSMLSMQAMAAAHSGEAELPASADESILIAIKEALVEEAQSATSQVINTAWLDSKGQLHESTMVQSGMRVRGIQVKSYLDQMQKPKVEIALDEKQGALPACFAKDDHLTRTVRFLPVAMTDRFGVDSRQIALMGSAYAAERLRALMGVTEDWRLADVTPKVSGYQAMVSGITEAPAQYVMHITASRGQPPFDHKAEVIPGSDPIQSFFSGAPSMFAEDWMRLTVELKTNHDGTLIWTGVSDFRIPVRSVGYGDQGLPKSLGLVLESQTSIWADALNQYARCEPVSFRVATRTADRAQLDAGQEAGLQVGDRLLLIDAERIPNRVLEPGTLAELSLVQVVSVETGSAEVAYAAGAPITDATGKVALPF